MAAGGSDDVLRSLGFDDSGDESMQSDSQDGSVDIDELLGGMPDDVADVSSNPVAHGEHSDESHRKQIAINSGEARDSVAANVGGVNDSIGNVSAIEVSQPLNVSGASGANNSFDVEGLLGLDDTSSDSATSSHRSSPQDAPEDPPGAHVAPHVSVEAGVEGNEASSSDDESVDVDQLLAPMQETESAVVGTNRSIPSNSNNPTMAQFTEVNEASMRSQTDPMQDLLGNDSHATSSSEDEGLADVAVSLLAAKHASKQAKMEADNREEVWDMDWSAVAAHHAGGCGDDAQALSINQRTDRSAPSMSSEHHTGAGESLSPDHSVPVVGVCVCGQELEADDIFCQNCGVEATSRLEDKRKIEEEEQDSEANRQAEGLQGQSDLEAKRSADEMARIQNELEKKHEAEEARAQAELKVKRVEDEAAQVRAELEAKHRADEARVQAELEAKRAADEKTRIQAELEIKRQAEEAELHARQRAEEKALAEQSPDQQVFQIEERLRAVNGQLNDIKAKVAHSRKGENHRRQELQELRDKAAQAEACQRRVAEKQRQTTADEQSANSQLEAMANTRSRASLLRTELSEMRRGASGVVRLLTKQVGIQCDASLCTVPIQTQHIGLETSAASLSESAIACIAELQKDLSSPESSWEGQLSDEDVLIVLLELSKEKRKARHFVEDGSSTGDPVLDQLLRRACAANALAREEAQLEAQCEALRQRCLLKTDIAQFESQLMELRRRLAVQAQVLQQFSECNLIPYDDMRDTSPPRESGGKPLGGLLLSPSPLRESGKLPGGLLFSPSPPRNSSKTSGGSFFSPSPLRESGGLRFSPEPRWKCSELAEVSSTDNRLTYSHAVQAVATEFNSLNLLVRQEAVAKRIQLASEVRSLHDELTSAVSSRAHVEESLRTAEVTRMDSAAKHRRQLAQASLEIRQSWNSAPQGGRGRGRDQNRSTRGIKGGNRSLSSSRINRPTSFM